jgi:hypothetical protein
MALADEIMDRYRSGGGGGGDMAPVEVDVEVEKTPAQIAAAKALIAAVKRGDAEAVCEAVKTIASEY